MYQAERALSRSVFVKMRALLKYYTAKFVGLSIMRYTEARYSFSV